MPVQFDITEPRSDARPQSKPDARVSGPEIRTEIRPDAPPELIRLERGRLTDARSGRVLDLTDTGLKAVAEAVFECGRKPEEWADGEYALDRNRLVLVGPGTQVPAPGPVEQRVGERSAAPDSARPPAPSTQRAAWAT